MEVGCTSCSGGDYSLEMAKLLRASVTEQNELSEALVQQNIAARVNQIDSSSAEGVAELVDIAV